MNKARVLVVEDEMLIAFDIADALADFGWEVVGPVGSVAEAMALLGHEQVDIAVLDVNLGGTKSYPIADKLAESKVPVLFLTGDRASDAPLANANSPVLSKPVDYQVLHQTLCEVTGLR